MPGARGLAAAAGDLIELIAEFGDQRAHGLGVACKVGRGGVGRGMKRHGLQRFMVRRNLGIGARIMVSLRCRLRQPGTFDPMAMPWDLPSPIAPLVGPGLAAPECKI